MFVQGRKNTFDIISESLTPQDRAIWFHCASLGEYEQGVPIMEELKKKHPNYKLVVTFFSPSGFEVKKNNSLADVTVYLPMDTKSNAKKFIKAINPVCAFFVKYEIWPNYLFELEKRKIPAVLVSGAFRKDQIYFKSHGSLMRKALNTFDHFFVQNEVSKTLLTAINLNNVTVSGDTRFDRVSHQIEMNNSLPFMDTFKKDRLCVVCGSTWPEDEAVLIEYINNAPSQVSFVMAPHKIDSNKIESFLNKLKKPAVRHSKMTDVSLNEASVLIVDNVGMLTKIYSYADIAYVGGGMGTDGLHNILEPATFGVPVVIGKNFEKFPEAERLRSLAGLFSVSNSMEYSSIMTKLVNDSNFRSKTGMICGHWINSNTGATKQICDYVNRFL
ncbi:3-deoxy-D-manno-octulosonic-acid transferase [unidentified eubacterium SCB49]|nr:3-deoxy-D-manno-octulosonic-acid transferase [unidentified eubacterium SCB49]